MSLSLGGDRGHAHEKGGERGRSARRHRRPASQCTLWNLTLQLPIRCSTPEVSEMLAAFVGMFNDSDESNPVERGYVLKRKA